jgi:hypothetical protein
LAAAVVVVAPSVRAQQGAAVLVGKVVDAATKAPVADVVVTVTSPALQGEQIAVTDATGQYRVQALPPGVYELRLEKESYKPYARGAIALRADSTIRLNAELLPEAVQADQIVVVAQAPTVDVGSSTTGMSINNDFTSRIPLVPPTSKGASTRSFEAVAEVVPQAQTDALGVSINGTTSLENSYVIDGLTTNNPGFADNGSPLSIEFVKEVNVITGGYMPEYGRSTGGILNVVTKSGSNEFRGSVWTNVTPGGLEGPRTLVNREGTTIQTQRRLNALGDFGFDLGGPIVKDKLWFYTGFQHGQTVYDLQRALNAVVVDDAGVPVKDPSTGFTQTEFIPGTARNFRATLATTQVMGKLTYTVNSDNRINLSVTTIPSVRGGGGRFGMDARYDQPETTNINGDPRALAHRFDALPVDTVIKWTSEMSNKKVLLDTTLGWHYEYRSYGLASDGSDLGASSGLASIPQTSWQRNRPGPRSIAEFENAPPGGWPCEAAGTPAAVRCPVSSYITGGSGSGGKQWYNRVQLRSVATFLQEWLGHHVIKAGVDFEFNQFDEKFTNSGGQLFQEQTDGTTFTNRQRAFLRSPDSPVARPIQGWNVHGLIAGGFVQDSWSIMDKVTLNAGVRYDAQFLVSGDGTPSLQLPSMWSPRLGLIYDPTQAGRSKLFANYARSIQSIPLMLASSGTSGNPRIDSRVRASACDPRDPAQQTGACNDDANRTAIGQAYSPDQLWRPQLGGKQRITPDIQPQSTDEIVVGGEYDVFKDARVGVSYTKRWLNAIIDEFSLNEGLSYQIGNIGRGLASDYPTPVRDYDAFTAYLMKTFGDDWIAQFSYTLSFLRGNYFGLFNPVTGFVNPNLSRTYVSPTLAINTNGPLPGDRTHAFKLFASKDFRLPENLLLNLGGAFRARSGEPTNFLGANPVFFSDTVYILPRGSGDRLPWQFGADLHVGFGMRWTKDMSVMATIDVFNLFNFQAITSRDQRYTADNVLPIDGGTRESLQGMTNLEGNPVTPWPNFGNPTGYQEPRQFRFGLRSTF